MTNRYTLSVGLESSDAVREVATATDLLREDCPVLEPDAVLSMIGMMFLAFPKVIGRGTAGAWQNGVPDPEAAFWVWTWESVAVTLEDMAAVIRDNLRRTMEEEA